MELKINKQDRILILTPHPDDESIGCGGLLLRYAGQCDVILLTDGAKGNRDWSEEKTCKVRKKEFQKVMKWLGVRKYGMLNIPDLRLSEYKGRLDKIDLRGYDYVLVPGRNETHPDHKVVYDEIRKNIKRRRITVKLLEYEVWTPMVEPSHYLDITEIVGRKKSLIQIYQSALMHIDYDRRITALNYYRGIHYGRQFVECYRLTEYVY